MIYHGTVKHGVVELEDGANLRDGTPVRVEPLMKQDDLAQPRQLGTLRGTVLSIAPDFDAPLDDFQEYMP